MELILMSKIKVSVGIFRKDGVIVEDPTLFDKNEFVIVISGNSFQKHIKNLEKEFTKDMEKEFKEGTDNK